MKNILWIYWENPPNQPLPSHIALCRKSMELNLRSAELRLVTRSNLREYLPDLPERIFDIRLAPRGRFEKYFGKTRRRVAAMAVQVDFIRAFLLERYGGFYIDSDAILLGDLDAYFGLLEAYDFCVTRRNSFGKTYATVNFYGSRAGGVVISQYAEALRRRLDGPLDFEWNDAGSTMLTPIVDEHREITFEIPESEVLPVTFEHADRVFTDRHLELDTILSRETRIFMLYSDPFRTTFKDWTARQLYESPILLSQAFRRAIPHIEALKLLRQT